MPFHKINLTQELDEFVCARVEGGRYEDINELVRAALRALDREERRNAFKRSELRSSDAECARRIAEIDVFRELWLNQHRPQATEGACMEAYIAGFSPGL
jgi:putative addiction module CopG family antidote